jgi:biopolymer transport protein ExbB
MNLLLQVTNRVADSLQKVAEAAAAGESVGTLDLILKGGVVVYILLAALAFGIYITVERSLYIKKRAKINNNLLRIIEDNMKENKVESALAYCAGEATAQGQVLSTGLRFLGSNMREIESAMETKAQVELSAMESNLSYLGLIARVAPMMGFVGTIWGVIQIFMAIARDSNLSIGGISEGLYVKMVTSMAGLVVGIITFICYSILVRNIDRFAERLQEQSLSFLEMLNKSSH